jgi:hypothetical protein
MLSLVEVLVSAIREIAAIVADLEIRVEERFSGTFARASKLSHRSSGKPLNTGRRTLPSGDLARYSIYAINSGARGGPSDGCGSGCGGR